MIKTKKIKNEGITIITLVITIIILLILAGTAIFSILGENGIITKTKQAKSFADKAQFEENVDMLITMYQITSTTDTNKNAYAELTETLNKYGYCYEKNDNILKITYKQYSKEINLSENDKEDDETLEWLTENNLLVSKNNLDKYSSTYNNIKEGTVFLNYNINEKEIYNPRDLSLASAQYGLALISSFNKTKKNKYLEMAKLIGNNIIENKTFEKEYAHASEEKGEKLTCITSQMKMNNGKWTYDSQYYTYPLDSLMSCKLLIELTNKTGDTKYAEKALKVIDTWIYIQGKVGTGALPSYMYYTNELSWGEGMWPIWTEFPLDISYSLYLSGISAYKYTGEIKYKKFVDDYFSFVNNAFKNYNATFSFVKNGNTYKLPYEYVCKTSETTYVGKNQSNQTFVDSEKNDITTDQLFYMVLGLALYDKDSNYVTEFLKSINEIQFENGKFWGEYTINGEKGSFEENSVEILNSAFYIRLLRICDQTDNIPNIIKMLTANRKKSNDKNVNGSWTWNAEETSYVIETLATSVILQEVYTNGMP